MLLQSAHPGTEAKLSNRYQSPVPNPLMVTPLSPKSAASREATAGVPSVTEITAWRFLSHAEGTRILIWITVLFFLGI